MPLGIMAIIPGMASMWMTTMANAPRKETLESFLCMLRACGLSLVSALILAFVSIQCGNVIFITP
jgi:hypothetical protein